MLLACYQQVLNFDEKNNSNLEEIRKN